jgi:hypothetical protein
MVHKPKHKVHSFRGLLGDGGQDEINLERQNVNLAYRIVKLECFTGADTFTTTVEAVVSVWREKQTAITGTMDFTNADLLGMFSYNDGSAAGDSAAPPRIIFDNVLFSRNIYVTSKCDGTNTQPMNYYIEIEEVPVRAATLMQLKLGTARKLIGAKMGG